MSLPHTCRDQQVLEKKTQQDREVAAAHDADIRMEEERQRAVLAAQVLHPSVGCGWNAQLGTPDALAACTLSGTSVHIDHVALTLTGHMALGGMP